MQRTTPPKNTFTRTRKPQPMRRRYKIRKDHVGGHLQNKLHGFTKRDPVFKIIAVDHQRGIVECLYEQARYTFYIQECKLV